MASLRSLLLRVDAVLVSLLALAALLSLAACSPPPTPYEIPDQQRLVADSLEAAKLGAGDVFELRVYGEKSLSGVHRVSPDGSIQVPLVGRVAVAGLTPTEIGEKVAGQLRDGYLREPHVTVFVQEYNSKRIYVIGAVAKPGTFPFQDNMTVVQAITLAGGFRDLADQNGTVVTRVTDGTEERFVVPVEDITMGRQGNFVLRPGDMVYVPERIL